MESDSTSGRGSRFVRLLQYSIFVAFLAWCLVSFRRDMAQLSLAPLLRSWDLVVAAAALSLVNYLLRSVRWRYYLQRLGYAVPLRFAALTFTAGFAYTLSPGKLGEMARARYYLSRGVPLTEVAATFFAERLLDIAVVVVLAGFVLTESPRFRVVTISVTGVVGATLVLLAVFPWSRLAARLRSPSSIPPMLLRPLRGVVSTVVSTRPLFAPAPLACGFAIGLLAWGLEAIGLWVLAGMFPAAHLGLVSAAGIYGLALLAGGISLIPGGIGSAEAVMTALLAAHGFSVPEALLVTMTCRLVTLWLAVFLGWGAVFALRQKKRAAIAP